MAPLWTLIPEEERALNRFEAEMKDHAGKYHSLADVNPEAADEELYQMAYLLMERVEWREKREREAEDTNGGARAEMETAVPPYGGC